MRVRPYVSWHSRCLILDGLAFLAWIRHATLACYKALVKKNPKVSLISIPAWSQPSEILMQASAPLGNNGVTRLSWAVCFSHRFTFGIVQTGQGCPESIFRGRDPRTRSHREKLEYLRAFNTGCVSMGTSSPAMISRRVRVRGRTQVEAGSRTVLGIGPGTSPPTSDQILSLTSPAAPVELVNQVTGHLRLL